MAFTSIAEQPEPRERMVHVVKWYLSAFHAGRKGSVAKKPYNPILGEVFYCHWDLPCETEEPPPPTVRPHATEVKLVSPSWFLTSSDFVNKLNGAMFGYTNKPELQVQSLLHPLYKRILFAFELVSFYAHFKNLCQCKHTTYNIVYIVTTLSIIY